MENLLFDLTQWVLGGFDQSHCSWNEDLDWVFFTSTWKNAEHVGCFIQLHIFIRGKYFTFDIASDILNQVEIVVFGHIDEAVIENLNCEDGVRFELILRGNVIESGVSCERIAGQVLPIAHNNEETLIIQETQAHHYSLYFYFVDEMALVVVNHDVVFQNFVVHNYSFLR